MIMINDPVSLTFFLFSTLSFNTVLEVGTKEDRLGNDQES
jgi:hypothetical protein